MNTFTKIALLALAVGMMALLILCKKQQKTIGEQQAFINEVKIKVNILYNRTEGYEIQLVPEISDPNEAEISAEVLLGIESPESVSLEQIIEYTLGEKE